MRTLYAFIILIVALNISVQGQNQKNTGTKNLKQDSTKIVHGYFFVDKNGDGYNDNAPDHDGDGIPNGLDKDYNGPKLQWGKRGWKADSNNFRPRGRFARRGKGFRARGFRMQDSSATFVPPCLKTNNEK